jgi:heme/copper-type cytochrome/quinol oxidase subunit 3
VYKHSINAASEEPVLLLQKWVPVAYTSEFYLSTGFHVSYPTHVATSVNVIASLMGKKKSTFVNNARI